MPDRPQPGPADAAAKQVQAHLAQAGLIPAQARLWPLSGGQTNRLWRVETATGDLVVKLYATTPGNPLFTNDPAAEAALLRHLEGTGLAPRLHAALDTPSGPVLLYAHVGGTPWRDDPLPVARALARLHPLPPPPSLAAAPDGSAALTRQTRAILDLCDPAAARPLRRLEPAGSVPPSGEAALLHGDPVPGNLIRTPGHLVLIDWQCPAAGDPVHDLSLFLSPAMQQVYRGRPLSPADETRFLTAYGDDAAVERYHALAAWFHWRMAAYCLWRTGCGAADYRPALALECARLGA